MRAGAIPNPIGLSSEMDRAKGRGMANFLIGTTCGKDAGESSEIGQLILCAGDLKLFWEFVITCSSLPLIMRWTSP